MRKYFLPIGLFLVLSTAQFAIADVLTLKDGQTLTGTLVSRDANGVVFEIAGQQLTFKSENIAEISFSNNNAAEAVAAPQSATSAEPQASNQATNQAKVAPVGTRVVARTNTTINSRQHKAGHKFNARLEADLVANGVVVAPRGATLYGIIQSAKSSGRLLGKSELLITFTDIMINNQMVPMSTSGVKAVTEGTGRRTVGTTARAAAIGGLINGSDGAKDGAKVGLGLSVLSSGNSINIPAGTLLEFQLANSLTVQ